VYLSPAAAPLCLTCRTNVSPITYHHGCGIGNLRRILYHVAAAQPDQPARAGDGLGPVSDDDARHVERADGRVNGLLQLHVKGASGLVHHQHLGALVQREGPPYGAGQRPLLSRWDISCLRMLYLVQHGAGDCRLGRMSELPRRDGRIGLKLGALETLASFIKTHFDLSEQ
jgi:hypothetical protein